jgi:hypothetical protein
MTPKSLQLELELRKLALSAIAFLYPLGITTRNVILVKPSIARSFVNKGKTPERLVYLWELLISRSTTRSLP